MQTEFITDFNAANPPHNYELQTTIGVGGQAEVFKGVERETGNDVAVKVFHLLPAQRSAEQVKAFLEGNRIRSLNASPNIVTVHWQHVHADVYPYFAMEYVPSGTVADRLVRGEPMETAQAVSYVGQTALGMMYAHGDLLPNATRAKLVHRDLKPANLLVASTEIPEQITGYPDMSPHGRIKITDFGISTPGHLNEHSMTGTQVAAGTLPYMGPEQFIAQAVFGSDVYALGVVAYELLSGVRPIRVLEHQQSQMIPWYNAHHDQKVLPIHRARRNMDPIIEAVQEPITKALAKKVADRHTTMGDFFEDFSAAVSRGTSVKKRDPRLFLLGGRRQERNRAAQAGDEPTENQTLKLGDKRLPKTKQQTRLETKQQTLVLPEQKPPARRTFLRSAALLGGALLLGGDHVPAGFEYDGRDPQTIAYEVAFNVLQQLQKVESAEQAAYLIRHLIKREPQSMAAAVKTLQGELPTNDLTAAWLTTDLAPFAPIDVMLLLSDYQRHSQLAAATIAATALGSYSNTSKGTKDTQISSAINSYASFCSSNNHEVDLKTTYAAQTPKYPFKVVAFGPSTTSSVVMSDLQSQHQVVYAQALGMANAPYTPDLTSNALGFYTNLLASPQGQLPEVADAIKGLCRALLPYDNKKVLQTLTALTKNSAGIADETAQEIALELAAYAPDEAAKYAANSASSNVSTIIAMATAKTHPALLADKMRTASTDIFAWASLAQNPHNSAARAEAIERLSKNDSLRKGYGGMLAAALIIGQS